MPDFSFAAWYRRMGYDPESPVDKQTCAEALVKHYSYIGLLLNDKRQPSGTLVKLCRLLEKERDHGLEF